MGGRICCELDWASELQLAAARRNFVPRAQRKMRGAAKPGQRVSVPVLFVKQQRQFVVQKPDPGKRKQENARAKAKLRAIKMGIELPKTAQPARYKANSSSACAKEPLAEKVFKAFCTCKKSQCLTLYCFCRNTGVACNKVCHCQKYGCQNNGA